MNSMIDLLTREFEKNANPENAVQMKRYMKDIADYYGIKADLRRDISRRVIKQTGLPTIENYPSIVRELWQKKQREFQYFAQDLAAKYVRKAEWESVSLYEYMITQKSWWDTVDFIAANLVGPLLKKYPEFQKAKSREWVKSGHLWLQRTAILFQLKYKQDTDTELLFDTINQLKDIRIFFIDKAIGWVLREYSKTDPETVLNFVNTTTLAPLSRREALKRMRAD